MPQAPPSSAAAPERTVIDNLATAVLVFDAALRLIDLNPAAEALLEQSAHKLRGETAAGLFPEADVEAWSLARVLGTGLPVTEREMHLRLPGGRGRIVDCTVTPLTEPGQPGGALVELVALDRHKRITREEQAYTQSQSARAILRGLAHEIRNPLGGLRGAAQLLERELDDEALKDYTRVIIEEADRLQHLMDRMLGPRGVPAMRTVSVHEVTERVRALIEAEAPAGVEVLRDYDPSIPEIEADAELLIQAVLNVARNAVQALEGPGTVMLRTRIHRQYTIGQQRHRLVVAVDVTDSGGGVPEALRETLFYPMVTGRAGGTGLGLCIAQSLVNQHGGLIECRSEPGETTFSILLPLDNGR